MLMQALVLNRYNGPLELTEIPQPEPKQGEVRVRIAASGLNPLDTKIRAGSAGHAKHPLPLVLGIDMAGVVDAVGPGVSAFMVGDEVYGMTGGVGGMQGSLAQYAAVGGDLLAHKPPTLSMREAAALPLAFITSYSGIVDRANLQSGNTVLVQGGQAVSVMSQCKLHERSAHRCSQPQAQTIRRLSHDSARFLSTTRPRPSRTTFKRVRTERALISSSTQ